MPPLEKTEVVRARMTPEEQLMLRALAGKEDTMSDVLRGLVRRAYDEKFPGGRPRRMAPSTYRGIIRDVAGPIQFTAREIADRTRMPLKTVIAALTMLRHQGLVDRVDGEDGEAFWDTAYGGVDQVLKRATALGFDLDTDLSETPPERLQGDER